MLSCCKESVKVDAMAAPVGASTGYHAIGTRIIRGFDVTAATSAAQAGYDSYNSFVWSRHRQEYLSWSWGGCLAVLGAMQ